MKTQPTKRPLDGRAVEVISDIIEDAGLCLSGKTFGEHRAYIVRAVNEYETLKADSAYLKDYRAEYSRLQAELNIQNKEAIKDGENIRTLLEAAKELRASLIDLREVARSGHIPNDVNNMASIALFHSDRAIAQAEGVKP